MPLSVGRAVMRIFLNRSVVTVHVMKFATGSRGGAQGAATWFRAGHAHAGVLLLMSLLYFLFLDLFAEASGLISSRCHGNGGL